MTTLTYRQARLVVVGFGGALMAAVAAAAYLRGADLVEVGAIVLFLPVLAGLAFWYVTGGLIAAVLVSAVYLVVRFSTLGDLPVGEFVASAAVRTLLYLGLGVFGGAANRMLARALHKLELYDEIDDATGVGNARALLTVVDREIARAQRYSSVFSFAVLRLDRQLFDDMREAVAVRALRRLCQTVEGSVRTTDLVTRVTRDEREEVVVVMPETGREGAQVFLDRLVVGAREILGAQGMPAGNGLVTGQVLTFPGDDDELRAFREQVATAMVGEWVETSEDEL